MRRKCLALNFLFVYFVRMARVIFASLTPTKTLLLLYKLNRVEIVYGFCHRYGMKNFYNFLFSFHWIFIWSDSPFVTLFLSGLCNCFCLSTFVLLNNSGVVSFEAIKWKLVALLYENSHFCWENRHFGWENSHFCSENTNFDYENELLSRKQKISSEKLLSFKKQYFWMIQWLH